MELRKLPHLTFNMTTLFFAFKEIPDVHFLNQKKSVLSDLHFDVLDPYYFCQKSKDYAKTNKIYEPNRVLPEICKCRKLEFR